jgi:hypothetical protein
MLELVDIVFLFNYLPVSHSDDEHVVHFAFHILMDKTIISLLTGKEIFFGVGEVLFEYTLENSLAS